MWLQLANIRCKIVKPKIYVKAQFYFDTVHWWCAWCGIAVPIRPARRAISFESTPYATTNELASLQLLLRRSPCWIQAHNSMVIWIHGPQNKIQKCERRYYTLASRLLENWFASSKGFKAVRLFYCPSRRERNKPKISRRKNRTKKCLSYLCCGCSLQFSGIVRHSSFPWNNRSTSLPNRYPKWIHNAFQTLAKCQVVEGARWNPVFRNENSTAFSLFF